MPGTKVTYGGKTSDGSKIVSLKDKILRPALTSHFEVEIPVGAGNLSLIHISEPTRPY